jgi:hypothetical protein
MCRTADVCWPLLFRFCPRSLAARRVGERDTEHDAPQTMDDDEDESFLYSGIEKESGGSNGAAQSTSPSLLPPSTR